MRKLIEQLRLQIGRFIEQRDDFIMLAACSDDDAGITLQMLRDLEHASATDVFMLMADKFIQPQAFVSVAIERLREQHTLACDALAEKGAPPLPALPDRLSDESRPAELRLREAIGFARALVTRAGGQHLVWAMFPQRIEDRHQYLQFIRSFVPWGGVQPWMAGIRLLFRDEIGTSEFAPDLASAPRVRLMQVDMSPSAIQTSTEEDAADEELSEEERMQAVLALALLDYAHNRTEDAIARYNQLLAYYQRTENQAMQAFVINAFGDIYHRNGDLEQARHWYECAVPPAATAKDPLILSTIARNLGDVSYKSGLYSEAEQYFDGVDKLSTVTLDVPTKVRALEWRGLSQEQQGKCESAIASWEAAALLSRNMNLPVLLAENLEHLKRLNNKLDSNDKTVSVESERKTIQVSENH
jgi:tetratricopeptide (TPR) repeat protein